jgi:hypothetical protein
MTLVAEKNAMNAFAADINPKERAALIIVNHAFADDISGPDESVAPMRCAPVPFNRRLLWRVIAQPIHLRQ